MIGAFLAILLAQASPSPTPSMAPSPAPTLSPAWVKAPLDKRNVDEYAHFVRHEQDGTDSELVAMRQVCDCQPAAAIVLFTMALSHEPKASIHQDQITICGQTADRLTASGVASAGNSLRNSEIVLFRREPALYLMMYTFRYATPMPDAAGALPALCP